MKVMNTSMRLSLAGLVSVLMFGCSNIERSRNVSNPNVSGKTLAEQVCSNCHGMTGESASPMFPKLAGQQKAYLVAQITDFKGHDRSDSRGATYMWGFTHLTTPQVDELAEYFSAQPPMAGRRNSSVLLARGEEIFRHGLPDKGVVQCAACHGTSGEGNGTFPRLAGQHANYVIEQIKVLQQTDQRPRGAAMKQVTHELSESETMAVAQYLESIGSFK